MNPSFFDVSTTPWPTSAGDVDLPILYHDNSAVQAFFLCAPERLRPILEGTGLRPALVLGRNALVAVAGFEYRKTSVGSYNEVAVALAVYPPGRPDSSVPLYDFVRPLCERALGVYIAELPVTTTVACAAGRELWGYPKFVTEIPFQLGPQALDFSVLDPQNRAEILHLWGELGFGVRLPGVDLMTYSNHQGAIVRTEVRVDAPFSLHPRPRIQLRVGPSTHRMAETVRRLGLDGARPALVLQTNTFRSILPAGTPCAAHPTPPLPYDP